MLLDVAGSDRAAFDREFDVCVIGSGPAGLSLARSLAAQGLDVALMEAGGLEWSPESQDVYAGENIGLDYHDLDAARLRYFGGTSGHWNGFCREFDAPDFHPRPQNAFSLGWPIRKDDLDPFAQAAVEILDIGPGFDFPDHPRRPGSALRHVRYRFSPPTRFAEKYLGEITAAERILLGIHANLVDLRLDDGLTRVTGATFRSYAPDDPGFTVRAQAYCLCTGGIENARLLLNFRSQAPKGIGNDHDLVGRFFNEHTGLFLGEVVFEQIAPDREDVYFATSEAFLAEHATLAISMGVLPSRRGERSLATELAREAQCALPFADRLVAAVSGRRPGRCDTGGLADYLRSLDPESNPWGLVYGVSELALNPESRVTLSGAVDAFGLNRVRLNWAVQDIDYRTLQLSALALAQDLAEAGTGRMRVYDWLLAEDPTLPLLDQNLGPVGSWHHMCTTRMNDDPRSGVVDRDCRVHGLDNLYIGGCSVFASGSFVNPTYTIVQLALRLADRLGRDAQARSGAFIGRQAAATPHPSLISR